MQKRERYDTRSQSNDKTTLLVLFVNEFSLQSKHQNLKGFIEEN
jgi:hypothetical protein